jgi:hypothetical protein
MKKQLQLVSLTIAVFLICFAMQAQSNPGRNTNSTGSCHPTGMEAVALQVAAVAEPSTLTSAGLGFGGLVLLALRVRKSAGTSCQ